MKKFFLFFRTRDGESDQIPNVLIWFGIIGIIVILIYGIFDTGNSVLKSSECVLLSFASSSIGVFIGFLFGIPKHTAKISSGRYTSNTNLEEISDWLTKILVGLGLAQIRTIPSDFESLISYISISLINVPQNLIASIIIYYLVIGFLTGYLITRLYLSIEFAKKEDELQKSLGETVAKFAGNREQPVIFDDQTDTKVSFASDMRSDIDLEKPVAEIIIQTKILEDKKVFISAEQYFKQGRIMVMNQNYKKAKEYFQKSYSIDKNYKGGNNCAVITSRYLNNYTEAEALFKILIDAHPEDPLAYYNLACNYVRANRFDDALSSLEKAIELGKEIYQLEAKKDSTFEPLKDIAKFQELVPEFESGQ